MSQFSTVAGVILAAGQGTRMKSDLPKGLHSVCGLPMVEWVGRSLTGCGVEKPIVVIGHGGDLIRASLGDEGYDYVEQSERLGTGHAVMMAAPVLASYSGPVLVTAGDTPLLSADTLKALVQKFTETGAAAVLATCVLDNPKGYGRILRDGGRVTGIVEDKDCSPAQREIKETNPAVYCFDCQTLLRILPQLKNSNSQGEYYLTDVIGALVADGAVVEAVAFDDPDEFRGVNDRWQLAEATEIKRRAILRSLAESGVTIVDPGSTDISADVQIGRDTCILPNTVIEGKTVIGVGCHIGPNSWIKHCVIADDCRVFMSHLERAKMDSGSRVGPFSNLRPHAVLKESTKIGNFVEVKNSVLGPHASVSHLTYLGDAEVGEFTNIGAGTITCNYDGFGKSKTVIGNNCFVGSNSTLIAPLTIGDEAMVAAGSVVSKDVPEGAMAMGRARQENKEGWFRAWRKKKLEQ